MLAKTLTSVAVFDNLRGKKIGLIPKGVQFEYIKKDITWLQRKDGTWVNCGAQFQYVQIINSTPPTTPPPVVVPPATEPVRVILVRVSDGKISLDGGAYE